MTSDHTRKPIGRASQIRQTPGDTAPPLFLGGTISYHSRADLNALDSATMASKTRWTALNWQDPFELDSQLSEEQR
ncbi:MAG: hypothetical protein VXA07_09055, partial [Halieaceae bacterium]